MKRATRPDRALVDFDGVGYQMDVMACRYALVRRRVEGEFPSMERLADAVGCSRSTVSRFFGGRQTSLSVALTILGNLKLTFDEVYTRCVLDGPAS
jgi:AraC-like DNA-binding protein